MSNVLLLFNKRSKVLLRLWHGLDDPTCVRSLGVVIWPYLHLSISTALIRPRRPKQYCLQLVIYIYIYIYLYCGRKKTNNIQIHPYKPVSWLSYYVVQGNNKSPDERATTYHVYMYLLIGSYSRLLESLRHRWRHHQLHFASNYIKQIDCMSHAISQQTSKCCKNIREAPGCASFAIFSFLLRLTSSAIYY